jgi:ribonuclease HI
MQIVTDELLNIGVDEKSNISKSQLILLDIKDTDKDKWKDLAINKELSDARAELFVLLNGIKEESIQEKIIDNYKILQKFRKNDFKKDINTNTTNNKKVVIYCDGGCNPNPGKAGSGIAIYKDSQLSELWYGLYQANGTNNTAELGALYNSLLIAQKEIENNNEVEIKCDSMYSINCIKTWANTWEKNGWTKKGGEIKNLDIIKKTYYLYNKIRKNLKLTHVKAHSGLEGNELADRMTIYAIKQKNKELTKYNKKIDVDELLNMR